LVYQDLAIGVARPTTEEMQGVLHHMIGVVSPTTVFSAGLYMEMARPILDRLIAEDTPSVMVGGTGFYLKSLLQPAHLSPVPVDEALRATLRARLETDGVASLYAELEQLDPQRASQLYATEAVRIVRALEINLTTGQPVPKTPDGFDLPVQIYGLTYRDRDVHVSKIRQRLVDMVEDGFLDEVQAVYTQYGPCFALENAHGYPEFLEVVLGQRTLESAIDQVAINIRQYSKRQMTWFKRLPQIQWFEVDVTPLEAISAQILNQTHPH